MLPKRKLLLLWDVRFHIVFCAVEACLRFDDCDMLLFELFSLELFLTRKFIGDRLYHFIWFCSYVILDQIFQLKVRLIFHVEGRIYYLL